MRTNNIMLLLGLTLYPHSEGRSGRIYSLLLFSHTQIKTNLRHRTTSPYELELRNLACIFSYSPKQCCFSCLGTIRDWSSGPRPYTNVATDNVGHHGHGDVIFLTHPVNIMSHMTANLFKYFYLFSFEDRF